jgi:hypothetical protein
VKSQLFQLAFFGSIFEYQLENVRMKFPIFKFKVLLGVIFSSINLGFSQPIKDTTFYYFAISKQISAYQTPLQHGASVFVIFNQEGLESYRFDLIHSHYTVLLEIRSFHDSGAVNEIIISENPGASLYHFKTHYFFSAENQPNKRRFDHYPTTVEQTLYNQEIWDPDQKKWVAVFIR